MNDVQPGKGDSLVAPAFKPGYRLAGILAPADSAGQNKPIASGAISKLFTKAFKMELSILNVDLQNPIHCDQVIKLLNDYMNDHMGNNCPMPKELGPQIITGLKNYPGYLGFFVLSGDQFSGLANCNINFSTFQAKPLLNIHDFIVAPEFRNLGAGSYLLRGIINYASKNGYCRVNLEVREDNITAKSLYKKMGFSDCVPRMVFWEKNL